MKGLAFILILSMGLLSFNRFTDSLMCMEPQMELSCSQDCTCCSEASSCCTDQEEEQSEDCQSSCDCKPSIQIASMELNAQNPIELSSFAFDYGSVRELYYFEYQPPHFQPPRFA